MGFLNLPILLPQLTSGKLRALAVSSKEAVPSLPEVKPFRAFGIEGLEAEGWAALLAARGVPPEARKHLAGLLNQALAMPAVRQRMETFGTTPVTSTPDGLETFLRAEIARWSEVVHTRGIKIE
jgi:tripartite-type tricarboxylate transporter receptor subunit TctC